MAQLNGPGEKFQPLTGLARVTRTPGPYLAKVFLDLQRADLVEALRGRQGGYRLARPSDVIHLSDVLDVLEQENWRTGCVMGRKGCTGRPSCVAHGCCMDVWQTFTAEFSRITIRDLKSAPEFFN